MSKRRVHVVITGRVQGVYFRQSTFRQARACGVVGWVKNLPDGSVEAVFEGDEDSVNQLIAYVRNGPSHATVKDVVVKEEQYLGEFFAFDVR